MALDFNGTFPESLVVEQPIAWDALKPAKVDAPTPPASQCAGCAVRRMCLPAGLADWEERGFSSVRIGRRRVRKGQALCREGDPFHFMYAVRCGTFKAAAAKRDGGEQVTAFHLPGELMGFDAASVQRHPTTLTAIEDSEVCCVPYSQLSDASGELRTLRTRLVQLASTELVRDHQLLMLISNTHTEARVAAFLLGMSKRMQERGYSPSEFLLRMTRAEIGSYLGTTLETVSRCLSAFARRGFITVRKRRIQLLDVPALTRAFECEMP
ncbi:MAG: helix-turn-helix domain-containing protein [Burkholderiales bacterium]|nr:helix-turn-helix domain-containing protein [Burkholderiales bacterium]